MFDAQTQESASLTQLMPTTGGADYARTEQPSPKKQQRPEGPRYRARGLLHAKQVQAASLRTAGAARQGAALRTAEGWQAGPAGAGPASPDDRADAASPVPVDGRGARS